METICDIKQFDLLCVVVNYGAGKKVIKASKELGITGFTALLGKGTVQNHLLDLLGLNEVKKEIILLICEADCSDRAFTELNKKFKFEKPNHGIVFSTSIANLLGARNCSYSKDTESRGVEDIMYNAIFTIVDKGMAESVIDAAVLGGSKGGTIINARGAGIHEYSKLLAMAIEPEKEIVMILSEKTITEAIVSSIRTTMKIDDPGNGILFVIDINKAHGLY
nr:P-II family nitrogen regulator [Desulfosporosinus youngiae]